MDLCIGLEYWYIEDPLGHVSFGHRKLSLFVVVSTSNCIYNEILVAV